MVNIFWDTQGICLIRRFSNRITNHKRTLLVEAS